MSTLLKKGTLGKDNDPLRETLPSGIEGDIIKFQYDTVETIENVGVSVAGGFEHTVNFVGDNLAIMLLIATIAYFGFRILKKLNH